MAAKTVAITIFALIAATVVGSVIYSLLPYSDPPKTVDHVDLSRYVGLWYEISSIPFFFGEGCICSTANYTDNGDGTIRVENSCDRNGERSVAIAKAWPADSTNSKLKVEFFWPIKADYWVVALDADYRWAVVSHPSREYLWILSRTSHLEEGLYDDILANLKENKLPIEQLVLTSANC
jgi:apolipoprotein D and lipocalin family protein